MRGIFGGAYLASYQNEFSVYTDLQSLDIPKKTVSLWTVIKTKLQEVS